MDSFINKSICVVVCFFSFSHTVLCESISLFSFWLNSLNSLASPRSLSLLGHRFNLRRKRTHVRWCTVYCGRCALNRLLRSIDFIVVVVHHAFCPISPNLLLCLAQQVVSGSFLSNSGDFIWSCFWFSLHMPAFSMVKLTHSFFHSKTWGNND